MRAGKANRTTESDNDDDVFKYDKIDNSKYLHLLGIQMVPLYLCGILPPPSCSKSTCKSVLYNIFTTIILIWFPLHIGAQFMAMYEHRQQLEILTGLIFQVSLYITTGFLAVYYVFNRKTLLRLLKLLETKFIPELEQIYSVDKHKPIIKETIFHTSTLVWLILVEQWIVLFAWMCLPAMVRYYDILTSSEQKIDESLDSRDNYLKYFGMVLWLPPNVDKFPIYELVYTFNAVATYAVASNFEAICILFLIFIINITAYFKMLTKSIESLDEIFNQSLGERMNTGRLDQANSRLNAPSLMKEQNHSQAEATCEIQEHDDHGNEDQLQQHLINCIKYHQALLM